MQRDSKILVAISIATLCFAAAYAQASTLADETVCKRAINIERSGWVEGSYYAEEASRRGLTFRACDEMNHPPARSGPTYNPLASTDSDRRKHAFLEAALFFLTGVEPGSTDTVTDGEIVLRRYPIVAYLVDGNPCAVRLRNTNTNRVWQMDFCNLTRYEYTGPQPGVSGIDVTGMWHHYWVGQENVLCYSGKRDDNENYTDPDFKKIVIKCINRIPDGIGMYFFVGEEDRGEQRSIERMLGAFKFIMYHLTGKPY